IIKYCKKYLNSVHPKNKAKKMEINYFTEMTGCGAKLLSGKLNMWSQKMVVSYEETDVSLPRLYRV
ncbi:MAG TPA: hypothetical protein VHM20_00505, partial [Gammaproteobacteria bacterium]|nr:hypothetical protein [Gammaproteobacteria bacterium]